MRILHISDLHISAQTEADCKLLVTAMLQDAEKYASETSFDMAIFSGDLAQRGTPEEYEMAHGVLLGPLMERLHLSESQIFVVPGNHDVDRTNIRQMVERGLANILITPEEVDRLLHDEAELPEAIARLSAWQQFIGDHDLRGAGDSSNLLATAERLNVNDATVGIVLLNSAWRCAGDADKGNLLVGASSAADALRAVGDCDVRLAVFHHPLDWLQSFEADQMRTELESQGFVVLYGHEHSTDPSARQSPRGEAIYLQAGCLYTHPRYPNAYMVLDIDPKDRLVQVKIRRWSAKTRHFDAGTDDALGGEQSFELPAGGTFTDRGHPRFSVVKRLIAEAAADLRVLPDDLSDLSSSPASVDDILVKPRFLSIPYKEAQSMATLTEGVQKHEVAPNDELLGQGVVLLSGEPQSGVSSALLWLLSHGYDADASKMPAYTRLPDSKFGTAKQSVTLAKAASTFGYQREAGGESDPDLILAVDDVDPRLDKKCKRLIEFIQANPKHRFVLGCSASAAAELSTALTEADVTHTRSYLAPFGKSQLRVLAATVSRGAEVDLDRVYGLIKAQSLPQTPFTMLALITVMTGQQIEADDFNQSSLLEAFVSLLLGSGEFADAERLGMNYRKRIALLGELARALYDQPGWIMSITDVEGLFLSFFEKRALRISAGQVLTSLIERQILASDGEHVGFRHPALLHLFLGKWMLEDEAHKAELLVDPGKNAEAIGHAAALKRSDRDLLNRVGTFAREALEGIAEKLPATEVDAILERFDVVDAWDGNYLDKTLASLPERRSSKELDQELDRWSEALDLGKDTLERPTLSTAKELEKATMLISDVLRQSDLVDDRKLKQELFELAVEGWIVLIGLATAEDHIAGPMREMMEVVLDKVFAGEDGEEDGGNAAMSHRDKQEAKEALDSFILLIMTMVSAAIAQAKLGAKSLAATIEACLDNEEFTRSVTAMWLAVWIESSLDIPEWPKRLGELLDRLEPATFLRNTAVGMAVHKYRSIAAEGDATELLEVLAPRLVSDNNATKKELAGIRESLRKSRRAYQSGLGLDAPRDSRAVLGSGS